MTSVGNGTASILMVFGFPLPTESESLRIEHTAGYRHLRPQGDTYRLQHNYFTNENDTPAEAFTHDMGCWVTSRPALLVRLVLSVLIPSEEK